MFFYENTSQSNHASFSFSMLFTMHLSHPSVTSVFLKPSKAVLTWNLLELRNVFPFSCVQFTEIKWASQCICQTDQSDLEVMFWSFPPLSQIHIWSQVFKEWCQLVRSMTRRRERSSKLIPDTAVMLMQLGAMTSHSWRVETKPAIVWRDFCDFFISELTKDFCAAL